MATNSDSSPGSESRQDQPVDSTAARDQQTSTNRFDPSHERRLRSIAENLQGASDAERTAIRDAMLDWLPPERHNAFNRAWANTDASPRDREILLAVDYADEFAAALTERYTPGPLAAIERAVRDAGSDGHALRRTLVTNRDQTRQSRRSAGRWFVSAGIVLVFSNLLVLPGMAWGISYFIEHPAAIAIRSLQDFIENTTTKTEGGGEDSHPLYAASGVARQAAQLADAVEELQRELASGSLGVFSDEDQTIRTLRDQIDLLGNSETFPISVDAPEGGGEITVNLSAEQVAQVILPYLSKFGGSEDLVVYRKRFRGRAEPATGKYYIIPHDLVTADSLKQALTEGANAMAAYSQAAKEGKEASEKLETLLSELLEPATEGTDGGLIAQLQAEGQSLSKAGGELAKLGSIGGDLAAKAKSAIDTLDSTANFVMPYAYAVLAIGAMFVTIGVTSMLKSLKVRDDGYDEAAELNRTLMLARLASAMHAQGVRPDAVVERIARVGESPQHSEGIPTPIARALTELAETFKK